MKEVIRTFGWTIRILEDEPARHWHFAVRRLRKAASARIVIGHRTNTSAISFISTSKTWLAAREILFKLTGIFSTRRRAFLGDGTTFMIAGSRSSCYHFSVQRGEQRPSLLESLFKRNESRRGKRSSAPFKHQHDVTRKDHFEGRVSSSS